MGRQVKACSACRLAKIKCNMHDGIPPCERCKVKALVCQIDKNTQSIIEEASKWQTTLTGQVAQLQTAVNVLLRMSDLPLLSSYNSASPASLEQAALSTEDEACANDEDESLPVPPILTPVTAADDRLYSLPVNSLYEITRLPSLRNPDDSITRGSATAGDFISRGLISEDVAQQLFTRFKTRLDPFCYGMLCPYDNLKSVRHNSALLMASICAVAALHDPEGSDACRICHTELLRLVSNTMFSVSHTTDDVRALIIGAFWLSNVSYFLIGHTIQIAMRLNYHLAYFSVVARSHQRDDVDKARLWYALYILDHHSSILYGRPALISSNEEPYHQWELFITTNGQCEVDLRLSSQIALYHVISKVKDVFGGYTVKPVPEHCLLQLRNFFAELDKWYMIWGNRMSENTYVGWFPRDGAIMHYHFARLHLCSYVFRGMSLETLASASTPLKEYAAVAVSSATSALQLILEREALQNGLVGMPLYFHGMIAFAAVFLIKAARNNFWGLTMIAAPEVLDLVRRCVHELRSQHAARQHMVYHLSNGLDDMMAASANITSDANSGENPEIMLSEHQIPLTLDSIFALDSFNLLQAPIPASATPDQSYQWQGDYNI